MDIFQEFCGMRYVTWKQDLVNFQQKQSFSLELNHAFTKHKYTTIEGVGEAYSVPKEALAQIHSFKKLLFLITQSATQRFDIFFPNQKLAYGLKRGWANEMNFGSRGKIHYHSNDINLLVLIYYHKVPKNSAKIVFIDPKYKQSLNNGEISFDNEIPENDKQYIDVEEGMCLLHDGRILHGVSEHKLTESRQSIIIDLIFPAIK